MAIPHGDPEKFYNHMCLFFAQKMFFHGDNTMSNSSFLSNFTKDTAFTKQMMQLIANLDDDSVNHLCSLDNHSLKQQLFEYLQE